MIFILSFVITILYLQFCDTAFAWFAVRVEFAVRFFVDGTVNRGVVIVLPISVTMDQYNGKYKMQSRSGVFKLGDVSQLEDASRFFAICVQLRKK